MNNHDTRDDLEIQIDVNPRNSKSFELNIIDNIGAGTSSNANSPLYDNVINECLMDSEEDDGNEIIYSLHDTLINYFIMSLLIASQ